MIEEKRRALGRGLETLLPAARAVASIPVGTPQTGAASTVTAEGSAKLADGRALEIELEKIERNPYQTRTRFDETALNELAASIKANGVMQPIVVRRATATEKQGRFQLITGERRWLASQRA